MTGLPDTLRRAAFEELLTLEVAYRQRAGRSPKLEELVARFPHASRDWLEKLGGTVQGQAANENPTQLGDYRIVERIGRGGMGVVYKAVHQRMGRTVALKLLRREMQGRPELLRRFNREVRAAARLTHPNIVAALDAREEGGLHYLITEYVSGRDLNETVRQQGPLAVEAAVDCVLQAARGLEYAHSLGIVHRDIKPANLLRGEDGVVKVLDMGLARFDLPEELEGSELTESGMVMGTAAYMAPEQGRDTRRADARSDLYSLGCTLYFLLTGRSMFSGASAVDMIMSHVSEPIPRLSSGGVLIPAELERVFRKMVAKEPGERFQTASDVISALETCPLSGTGDETGSTESTGTGSSVMGAAATEESVSTANTEDCAEVASNRTIAQTDRVAEVSVRENGTRRWRRRGWAAIVLTGVACLLFYATGHRPVRRDTGGDGASLEFNGGSSYMVVPDLVPAAGESYTVELIVQPLDPQPSRPSNVVSWLGPDWMAIYRNTDGRWGLARRWEGRSLVFASREFDESLNPVHLAGVFDGGELRLFIGGREATPSVVDYQLDETSGGLFIGGVPPGHLPEERGFRGRVDAIRITRGIRYETSFAPPERLDADETTLALFPLPEGAGNSAGGGERRRWDASFVDCQWTRWSARDRN